MDGKEFLPIDSSVAQPSFSSDDVQLTTAVDINKTIEDIYMEVTTRVIWDIVLMLINPTDEEKGNIINSIIARSNTVVLEVCDGLIGASGMGLVDGKQITDQMREKSADVAKQFQGQLSSSVLSDGLRERLARAFWKNKKRE